MVKYKLRLIAFVLLIISQLVFLISHNQSVLIIDLFTVFGLYLASFVLKK